MDLNHAQVIEQVIKQLDEKYVYPELAQQINAFIQGRVEK